MILINECDVKFCCLKAHVKLRLYELNKCFNEMIKTIKLPATMLNKNVCCFSLLNSSLQNFLFTVEMCNKILDIFYAQLILSAIHCMF